MEDWRKYNKQFREESTAALIRQYPNLNAEYKAIARAEFEKRGVPESDLPYKKHKREKVMHIGNTRVGGRGFGIRF